MPVVQPYFDIQPPVWENFFSAYMNAYLGRREPIMEAEYKRRMAAMDPAEKAKLRRDLMQMQTDLKKARMAIENTQEAKRGDIAREMVRQYGARTVALIRGETTLQATDIRARADMALGEVRASTERALAGIVEDDVKDEAAAAAKNYAANYQRAMSDPNPAEQERLMRYATETFRTELGSASAKADPAAQGKLTQMAADLVMANLMARVGGPGEGELTLEDATSLASAVTGVAPGTSEILTMEEAYRESPSGYGGIGVGEGSYLSQVEQEIPGITEMLYAPTRTGSRVAVSGTLPGAAGVAPAGGYGGAAGVAPAIDYGYAQAAGAPPSELENYLARELGALQEEEARRQPPGDLPWDYYLRETFGPKDPMAERRTQRLIRLYKEHPAEFESMMNAWVAAKPGRARKQAAGIERTQDVMRRGIEAEQAPGGAPAMPPVNMAQAVQAFGPDNYVDLVEGSAALDRWMEEQGLVSPEQAQAAREEIEAMVASGTIDEQMATTAIGRIDEAEARDASQVRAARTQFGSRWARAEREQVGAEEREAALTAVPEADAPSARGVPEMRGEREAAPLPSVPIPEGYGPEGRAYITFQDAAEALSNDMDARGVPFDQQASAVQGLASMWGTTIEAAPDVQTVEGRVKAIGNYEALVGRMATNPDLASTWESALGGPRALADYSTQRRGETAEQFASRQAQERKKVAIRLLQRGVTRAPEFASRTPSMQRGGTKEEIAAVAAIPDEYRGQAPPSASEMEVMRRQAEQPVEIPETPARFAGRREPSYATTEEMISSVVENLGPSRFRTWNDAIKAVDELGTKARMSDADKRSLMDAWSARWPDEAWTAPPTGKPPAEDLRVMAPEIQGLTRGASQVMSDEDIARLARETAPPAPEPKPEPPPAKKADTGPRLGAVGDVVTYERLPSATAVEDRYLRDFVEGAVAEDVAPTDEAKAAAEKALDEYKTEKEQAASEISGQPPAEEQVQAQVESISAVTPTPKPKKRKKKKPVEEEPEAVVE